MYSLWKATISIEESILTNDNENDGSESYGLALWNMTIEEKYWLKVLLLQ